MMKKVHFKIKLTPKQKEAHDILFNDVTKVLTCVWSRQCGKTVFAEIACIKYLLSTKKSYVGYITPTFALSRKVYKDIVSLLQPTGELKSYNSTTLTIEAINGNVIQFYSQEAYKSIRGQTIRGLLVIDEAAYMSDILPNGESFWSNVVQPITKAYRPKILIISTPCGRDGFFYDYYNKGTEQGEYRHLKATIWDDPNITKEEIYKIKEDIAPQAFRQEYECEFLSNSLTVFPEYENQFKKLNKIEKDKSVWLGIDLSSVGEDNTVITALNKNNETQQWIITGELDTKYKKIADIINSFNKLQTCYIETNGVGEPMINEIKKLVKYKNKITEWLTTNSTKAEIIGILQNKIANKDVWFDIDNTTLYQEMGYFTYTISKTKKITYAAKNGKHDDTVMSLAIALKAKEDIIPLDVQKDIHFVKCHIKQII